jgi:KH domain
MEQLVHLRLKSIYKAFQQSARTSDKHVHLKRAALAAQKKALSPRIDPAIQQAQADAAAASLLKELEEEEEAETKKLISKKKKKRKKKKTGNYDDEDIIVVTKDTLPDEGDPDKECNVTSTNKQQTLASLEISPKKSRKTASGQKDMPILIHKLQHQNPSIENRVSQPRQGTVYHGLDSCIKLEICAPTHLPSEPKISTVEALEKNLLHLVTSRHIFGIEQLLEEWKGVPGRSVLRKNAKKVLKKLKEEEAGKQMLKILSSAEKSKTFEVVLEISPLVVGWVIGKGGVKIRDLMEESGAKVWIDRESMQVHEPRIIYVSGPKDSVDLAVNMIQKIVKQAPCDGKDILRDDEIMAEPQLVMKGNSLKEVGDCSDWAEHKIACESGFVPLLIGKRGWTIKHIQDSSGAKVDIDQHVTPRVVTITGRSESVQTAIRMVRDVLSYPQGQLQRKDDDEDILDFDRGGGVHSPPPSSLIMTSNISASSSLSSTPEPSMASSRPGKSRHDQSQNQQHRIPHPPGLFDNRIDNFTTDASTGIQPRQQPSFQHAVFTRHEHHFQEDFAAQQQGFHRPMMEPSGASRMIPPGMLSVISDTYSFHSAAPRSMQSLPPEHPPILSIQAQSLFHRQQQANIHHQCHESAADSDFTCEGNHIDQSYQQLHGEQRQRHHPVMWEVHSGLLHHGKKHQLQQPIIMSNLKSNLGALPSSTQNDSNLIDSLFGPSGNDSILLDSFRGLGISGWGSSGNTDNWNVEKGGSSRPVSEHQHPSESRFNWG